MYYVPDYLVVEACPSEGYLKVMGYVAEDNITEVYFSQNATLKQLSGTLEFHLNQSNALIAYDDHVDIDGQPMKVVLQDHAPCSNNFTVVIEKQPNGTEVARLAAFVELRDTIPFQIPLTKKSQPIQVGDLAYTTRDTTRKVVIVYSSGVKHVAYDFATGKYVKCAAEKLRVSHSFLGEEQLQMLQNKVPVLDYLRPSIGSSYSVSPEPTVLLELLPQWLSPANTADILFTITIVGLCRTHNRISKTKWCFSSYALSSWKVSVIDLSTGSLVFEFIATDWEELSVHIQARYMRVAVHDYNTFKGTFRGFADHYNYSLEELNKMSSRKTG